MLLPHVMNPEDFKAVSAAVQSWYLHFKVEATVHGTGVLCAAAIKLLISGRASVDELSTGLMELFPVPELIRQNAPSSHSVH